MMQTPPQPDYSYQPGHARARHPGLALVIAGGAAAAAGVAAWLYASPHASACDSDLGILIQGSSRTLAQDCQGWTDLRTTGIIALTAGIIVAVAGLAVLLARRGDAAGAPAAVMPALRPAVTGPPASVFVPPLRDEPPAPGPDAPPPAARRLPGRGLIAAGALAALAAGVVIGHSLAPGTPARAQASAPGNARALAPGTAVRLAGIDAGEYVTVRLVRVWQSATPAGQFSDPAYGTHLAAAEFTITNTGSERYQDAPDNSVMAVDSRGQAYEATGVDDVTQCRAWPENGVSLRRGASATGCSTVAVADGRTLEFVQFTPDSGDGSGTGQWGLGS